MMGQFRVESGFVGGPYLRLIIIRVGLEAQVQLGSGCQAEARPKPAECCVPDRPELSSRFLPNAHKNETFSYSLGAVRIRTTTAARQNVYEYTYTAVYIHTYKVYYILL